MHRVTLIQRVLPHYRISFVRALRERLWAHDIELELIYGQERAGTVPRTVALNETWARCVSNVYTNVAGVELVWQRCLGAIGRSDLIIVEQSNRLLVNYLLQLQRWWSPRRMAFWGHGRNFQSAAQTFRERMKQRLIGHVDWWFAYTDLTRSVLVDSKYPESRVTVVNNAIDDAALQDAIRSLAERDQQSVAASIGCNGERVAIYVGGLYRDKRLDFLLQAARLIKAAVPEFELVVVGDGPDRHIVEQAAVRHSWIKYAGAKTGVDVAPYLSVAQVVLMPGLVGLVLLDSFIARCPLVTTEFAAGHSPEMAYLQPGVNGVMTRDDVHAYAAGVIGCLQDRKQLESLRDGCRASAQRYSMSAMVENFASGIERCLARS